MSYVETKIIKIGNSYGVRIPAWYLRSEGIKLGDKVDIKIRKALSSEQRSAKQVKK